MDSGRAHFVCAVVHKYSSPLSRVRWFMLESNAIVYICTYYVTLTGLKILLQTLQRITAAAWYKFNYWRYKNTFVNPFCLRSFRYFLLKFSTRLRRFPARHDQ